MWLVFAKYTVVLSFLGLTSALLRDMVWLLLACQAKSSWAVSKGKSLKCGKHWDQSPIGWGSLETFIVLWLFEFSKDDLGAGLRVRKRDGEAALKALWYFLLILFHWGSGECVLIEGENSGKVVGNTDFAADRLGDSGCDIFVFCLMSSLSPDGPGLTQCVCRAGR